MVKLVNSNISPSDKSPLAQWIYRTIWLRGVKVKFQVRGNILHLLCEGTPCPDRRVLLLRLLPALQQTNLEQLLPIDHPPIYQILLYGRLTGKEQPTWTAPINLNQVDRHLEQLRHSSMSSSGRLAGQRQGSSGSTATMAPPETAGASALVLSNRSLARQGNPDAIAHYLAETLGSLGIAVRVTVKTISFPINPEALSSTEPLPAQRLWITCEATYSPDPMVIGEPVAQQLRDLKLEGYRDAVILIQVLGEDIPDWQLKVDLTPPEDMLREWARWGDVEAIARLLQDPLAEQDITLSTAILKDSTLHLSFNRRTPQSDRPTSPDRDRVNAVITPLLDTLGPQGIHGATLYGQDDGQDGSQENPAWVDWVDLPAAKHTALAPTPMALAQQGDWQAIAFLLDRLLNSDLDKYLATGGIRIQLRMKQDLVHVMADAPVCPQQRQVGKTVVQFFKQLRLPIVSGVRVYGRRAGQKRPLWTYGSDFVSRQRLVPEATPEFAATDAYVGELFAQPGHLVVRPELTADDLKTAWDRACQRVFQVVQQGLIASQVMIPVTEPTGVGQTDALPTSNTGRNVTLIWGTLGVLLTMQTLWGVNQWLQRPAESVAAESPTPTTATLPSSTSPEASPWGVAPSTTPSVEGSVAVPQGTTSPFSAIDLNQVSENDPSTFNPSGFTASPPGETSPAPVPDTVLSPPPDLPYTQQSVESQLLTASILSSELPFSTFNSRQLDEKLLLYQTHVEEFGIPDVMVIGSSRALRGVDPTALTEALEDVGYEGIDVFNFGINGATAQVVEFVVRRLLPPEQLPRLIIWADGARAFNSGTVDMTYNGIAVSEGYRDLANGKSPLPKLSSSNAEVAPVEEQPSADGAATLKESYEEVDRWLSDQLARLVPAYGERDRLKQQVQQGLVAFLPDQPISVPVDPSGQTSGVSVDGIPPLVGQENMMDLNGFLALSTRFNPATYYQQYARVEGRFDSDYQDFRIQGEQETALASLLEFTRSQQIPIIFINLPLTQEYLDPIRLEYEQVFKQYMLSVALSQPGLVFRDLGEEWLSDYDYFSDPSHLNRYGAYQISNRIAQDPMIPWQTQAE